MDRDSRWLFYRNVIAQWITERNASILVVAGGRCDRDVFDDLGFHNVVISNVDTPLEGHDFTPFEWSLQNAESLTFRDEQFDYVVAHAGLHHCLSPHRALCEMYRVARRAAIFFESRDSLLMRLMELLKLTSTYETTAVYYNDCQHGGAHDTDIPNFVYRWTEREVEKTISSYAPYARHKFHYRYGYDGPRIGLREKKGSLKVLLIMLLKPFYEIFVWLFTRQQNQFACKVDKPVLPNDLHTWIIVDNNKITFNREWADGVYKHPLERS